MVTDVDKLDTLSGKRFTFGENWTRFIGELNDDRIAEAEKSLCDYLAVENLVGKRFLDAGSGSGLFSLAAMRLGATVYSFDFDLQSVACTLELKARYFPNDINWTVEQGSVLDQSYLESLGTFEYVYSWGVLHHTGAMLTAFGNVAPLVASGGSLFVSIYNDQGFVSRYWTFVKYCYVQHWALRVLITAVHFPYLVGLRYLVRAITSRNLERGMSLWYDMIDWIGGYPFEVARPEEVFEFYRSRGFNLVKLKTCAGRSGCNEFVFSRQSDV